jgi:hypothetical protein
MMAVPWILMSVRCKRKFAEPIDQNKRSPRTIYKGRKPLLEYLLRFIAGGVAVSAFAAFGDAVRPKSFAGLFGAAPSIALATLLMPRLL